MQDRGCGLPATLLLGTWVNKGRVPKSCHRFIADSSPLSSMRVSDDGSLGRKDHDAPTIDKIDDSEAEGSHLPYCFRICPTALLNSSGHSRGEA
jgi:hypothetical protein